MDSICGCFSVGLIPTGVSDPYALRRQGIGIVQIMLEKEFSFSLNGLIEKNLKLFGERNGQKIQETADKVRGFLKIGWLIFWLKMDIQKMPSQR